MHLNIFNFFHQGGPVKSPTSHLVQRSGAPVRKQLIGQLVEAMPLADVSEKGQPTEAPLWQVVEDHDDEKPFWTEVEGGLLYSRTSYRGTL